MTEKCCALVWDDFTRKSHQCQKPAKYSVGGQQYCGTHNPEAKARRRAKANEKWQRKQDAFADAVNQRKQDKADAERYRWLRDSPNARGDHSEIAMLCGEALDAAIDEAMAKEPQYTLTDLGRAYVSALKGGE